MDPRGRETFKGQAEKEPFEPERVGAARARQRQGEAQAFFEKGLASLSRPSPLSRRVSAYSTSPAAEGNRAPRLSSRGLWQSGERKWAETLPGIRARGRRLELPT